jgi:hypothetical protein
MAHPPSGFLAHRLADLLNESLIRLFGRLKHAKMMLAVPE